MHGGQGLDYKDEDDQEEDKEDNFILLPFLAFFFEFMRAPTAAPEQRLSLCVCPWWHKQDMTNGSDCGTCYALWYRAWHWRIQIIVSECVHQSPTFDLPPSTVWTMLILTVLFVSPHKVNNLTITDGYKITPWHSSRDHPHTQRQQSHNCNEWHHQETENGLGWKQRWERMGKC